MDLVTCDAASAAASSLFVSPFVCIVDKSIISNASGRMTLLQCAKENFAELVTKPFRFLRRPEFAWIFGLYGVTYLTANVTDTVCAARDTDPTLPKFVTTSAVNLTVCIAKDRAFTRMFGVIAPTRLPLPTYGLFAARDSMTIFTSFSMPAHVANYLRSREVLSERRALTAAQLACPMAVQFLSTPLHLLGLDLYNKPENTVAQRARFIMREYAKSTTARLCRIGPAFGIGGVSNKYLRDAFRGVAMERRAGGAHAAKPVVS